MSNFEPNAVIRGFQLTVVGSKSPSPLDEAILTLQAVRALINPRLFKYDHFRQAALAIGVGIIIQLIIQIPVCSVMIRSSGE